MGNEGVGVGDGKRADGELEELEAVGRAPGLEVGGFRRVEGEDTVPRGRRGGARLLH